MRQYFLIDAEGWPDYESSQVFPVGEETEGYILGWEEPFYKPKWSGTAWIEGATEEEIGEATKEPEKTEEELTASQLMTAVKMAAKDLPDESILQIPLIFDNWEVDVDYAVGDVLRHDGNLYRVLQAHRSQADWIPPDAVSLYTRINPPGTVGPWRQPQGAHDAYQKDDKVTHKDKTWISTAKDNVWEPGVYGWSEVTE